MVCVDFAETDLTISIYRANAKIRSGNALYILQYVASFAFRNITSHAPDEIHCAKN